MHAKLSSVWVNLTGMLRTAGNKPMIPAISLCFENFDSRKSTEPITHIDGDTDLDM